MNECIDWLKWAREPRRWSGAVAVCAAWAASAGVTSAVSAQEIGKYPQHTVSIIVPYTPGTSADMIARLLAPKLSERWKVPVVTENRPGVGGNIGAEFVARAAPDGYTMLMTATAFGTTPVVNKRTPFDPIKDFKPVALAATSAMVLVVPPKLNVKSLEEFIAMARAQPGKLNYASPGTGTAQHLAMELLKQDAGVDIVHVPYKGTAGALTDVMANHVQVMVTSLGAASPFVHNKQLQTLALMSDQKSKEFPDLKNVREQGYPGLVVDTWYGMLAPAKTPDAIVAKWNAEINELLSSPEMVEHLAAQGLIAYSGAPDALGKLIASELARWTKVVAAAGISEN